MRLEQLSGTKPSYGKGGHCRYAGVRLYMVPVKDLSRNPWQIGH